LSCADFQKSPQRRVRVALPHAVKIEFRFDLDTSLL